ncbi:MAG: GGDEF domain-containing protein [Terracidiphilus sp.]
MISIKKYLDGASNASETHGGEEIRRPIAETGILSAAVAAYRSALREMGNCSLEACPALGPGLKQALGKLDVRMSTEISAPALEAIEKSAREQLEDWGRRTACHYRQTTGEVKELLIVMARTAESVGERDQRCAGQISEVTSRLKTIASLEDLAEIRQSIVESVKDLKTSLDRMAAEGNAAMENLRAEVLRYQIKLEKAEELASRDTLTGLRNRAWVEGQIERCIGAGTALSVAVVDIDAFKRVNDEFGHLIGDELLQQFAKELKSASRSTDVIGRWGGDEFILLLNSGLEEATAQIDRLSAWVCGTYKLSAQAGFIELKVEASIGLAEHAAGETMKELLVRADTAMYFRKSASRAKGNSGRR